MKIRSRNRQQGVAQAAGTANDELKYWRHVWRKARRLSINLSDKQWCDNWHVHFDWAGRGSLSRFEHRLHIRPLMHAFARAKSELEKQMTPYQVYVRIHPADPGSDALFVHTPNPHTQFPTAFEDCQFLDACPPLLMGLVNLARFKVMVSSCEGDTSYTIVPTKIDGMRPDISDVEKK